MNTLKEAVRLADLTQDEPLSFKARVFLMEACVFSGYSELALVHFPWLEACYNRNPTEYDPSMFNWMYSWVVFIMAYSPSISRKDIEQVMIRMEKSFRQSGKSERILLEMFRTVSTTIGDYDLAQEFHADYELTRHSGEFASILGLVNHRGIEIHNESFFYGRLGQYQKALDVAMPVLNGTIEYPSTLAHTLAATLMLFVQLGIPAEAEPHFQKALRLIRHQKGYKNLYPDLLVHTALKGDFVLGVTLVEEMAPWLENSPIGMEQFEYSLSCRLLFECMLKEGSIEIKLKLPKDHPLFQPDHTYGIQQLENFWAKKAIEFARRFDERNFNNAISDYLKQTFDYAKFAFRLP